MTVYYRVNLQDGIVTENVPGGWYSKSPELGVTVFKNLRGAKRKFNEISKNEIKRLRELRLRLLSIRSRAEMMAIQQETEPQ